MNVHQRILVIMAAPTLMEATSVDAPLDTTEPAKGMGLCNCLWLQKCSNFTSALETVNLGNPSQIRFSLIHCSIFIVYDCFIFSLFKIVRDC